jgi:hypothetical protein
MSYKDLSSRLANWFDADVTQQDYDLIQFVTNNNIKAVKYLGDCSFLKSVLKRNLPDPKICVFLVNQPFKFSELINTCNQEIKNMLPNSFFYLAINKFLAIPEPQENVTDDYDDAIHEYIKNNINCNIIKYYNGKDDYGQKFNWGHPLTRFYFTNESTI